MTKRAKKSLLIVLVAAAIFAFAVYWLQNLARTTYTSLDVTLTAVRTEETCTDSEILSLFSSALKNADYVDDPSIIEGVTPDVYVTAHSQNGEKTLYGIYLRSIFKRSAYVQRSTDGRVTRLAPSDFTEIFSTEPFSQSLTNTQPLAAYIITEETETVSSLASIGYPHSGTWNYAAADGKQISLPISGEDTDTYSLIKDNDRPFSLYMSAYPSELMKLKIYENGSVITELLTDGHDIPNPGRDGYFIYEITTVWPTVADVDYNGTVTYRFYLRIDMAPTPILSETSAPQGSVISLKAANGGTADQVTAKCEALDWESEFTNIKGIPTALMGIPLSAEPGDYEIVFDINGEILTETLTVTEGEFSSQNLTISTTVKQSWTDEQETYLTPLRQYVSARNYIDGTFIEPATGKITTRFGTFRYTNGAIEPTRHNGIDIANRNMPDVIAPMDGVVVFTMNMKLTGKTVVVDHGLNVLSYYYHLNTIDVEVGDYVATGDVIGQMGTTGYSTGVHLHYTVMVNGVAVDPNVFYVKDFSK